MHYKWHSISIIFTKIKKTKKIFAITLLFNVSGKKATQTAALDEADVMFLCEHDSINGSFPPCVGGLLSYGQLLSGIVPEHTQEEEEDGQDQVSGNKNANTRKSANPWLVAAGPFVASDWLYVKRARITRGNKEQRPEILRASYVIDAREYMWAVAGISPHGVKRKAQPNLDWITELLARFKGYIVSRVFYLH